MKRFKDILLVIEPESAYIDALERAIALAQNNQAQLTVLLVLPVISDDISILRKSTGKDDVIGLMEKLHEEELNTDLKDFRKRFEFKSKVVSGIPFIEIIREVLLKKHDLLIKIPDAPDWLDRFFSSDDMHLLRKCPCPVWLIRSGAPKAFKRVLAAVDVGEDYPEEELDTRRQLNQMILQIAVSQALSDFSELHVVHVWDAPGEGLMRGPLLNTPDKKVSAYVDEVKHQHSESFNGLVNEVIGAMGNETLDYIKPHKHLVKGQARKEVPVLVRQLDIDLVVMGTVGRTGLPGFFMGNTAETILNQIDCSVLAIKPQDFISPVTLGD